MIPRLLIADINVTGTDQNKNRTIKSPTTTQSRKNLPLAVTFNHFQLISPRSDGYFQISWIPGAGSTTIL